MRLCQPRTFLQKGMGRLRTYPKLFVFPIVDKAYLIIDAPVTANCWGLVL